MSADDRAVPLPADTIDRASEDFTRARDALVHAQGVLAGQGRRLAAVLERQPLGTVITIHDNAGRQLHFARQSLSEWRLLAPGSSLSISSAAIVDRAIAIQPGWVEA